MGGVLLLPLLGWVMGSFPDPLQRPRKNEHDLEALEESAILLTISWPHAAEIEMIDLLDARRRSTFGLFLTPHLYLSNQRDYFQKAVQY